MAEETKQTIKKSNEYVIPLKRVWLNVPRYKRTSRAVKAIKTFIVRHMKVPERDISKVKIDVYLNNDMWFKGGKKPPAKIKVKATQEGDIIKVEFIEDPQHVKFLKAKHSKKHKKAEKPIEKPDEEKMKEKTEEQKKEEKKGKEEAVKSTEIQHAKDAAAAVKAQKHTTKPEKKQHPIRKALKK